MMINGKRFITQKYMKAVKGEIKKKCFYFWRYFKKIQKKKLSIIYMKS